MASRFEQPINAQFMNTYVPIPFEAMMKAGQMKQERYDKTALALSQAQSQADMFSAIAGSPDEKRLLGYKSKLDEIADKYSTTKDLSDRFVVNSLDREIRNNVNIDDIKNIMSSRANWEQAQKAKQELALRNEWNPLLDEDPGSTWDSSGGKLYNYIPSAYMDKEKMFGDYFKNMQEDYVKAANVNGLDVMQQGVSPEKVVQTAKDSAAMMVGTPQGQAYVRQYQKLTGDTKTDPITVLYNEMLSVGKPFASARYTPLPEGYLKRMNGPGDGGGPSDVEWFHRRAPEAPKTPREARKTADKQYITDKTGLKSAKAEIIALENKGVPETDVRYKSAKEQVAKFEGDISYYEDVLTSIAQETEGPLKEKVESLKKTIIDKFATSLDKEQKITLEGLLNTPLEKRWGKAGEVLSQDIYRGLTDGDIVRAMRTFDARLNVYKREKDVAYDKAFNREFNYAVSDVTVKPLNYSTKQGRISIIGKNNTELDSQMNDFYTDVGSNITSYNVTDISEGQGNRIKKGKDFNEKASAIMNSPNLERIPGQLSPKIDREGNIRVQLGYAGKDVSGKNLYKKFEVKLNSVTNRDIIEGLARDYAKAGYRTTALMLSNTDLHRQVENHINSKDGYNFILKVPTRDGTDVEDAIIRIKRIGGEYVVLETDGKTPMKETAPNGDTRELVFQTRDEVEYWLYSKQEVLLSR